ncbi:amylo-alpha-1,6-glucosidase [Sphingosinicella humi]|uniref:Amylo-alpha-1,6-glucosidase n=1 Tax=Allosphingosinicella humi TaxID=2068657 RepID=A0A2U2J3L4_9SPHN|nr:amylo-alpha-1,6-glucosidase [Sphingosinicella humi]PWG02918.1 amylo-alpha-1,6-glucosidase [Sphingosinicella humi]
MNELAGAPKPPPPEDYYIEAETSLVDRPVRTLKQHDLFGVFNNHGDFRAADKGPEGLFFLDTRHLSQLELRLGRKPPLLLDSVVLDDNSALLVDLTNADLLEPDGTVGLTRDSVFANRLKFLCGASCHERITLRSYEAVPEPLPVELAFAADFADLFEVRGEERERHGTLHVELMSDRAVRFFYLGLDGVERTTTLEFDPAPAVLTPYSAQWQIDLSTKNRASIGIRIDCGHAERDGPEPTTTLAAYRSVRRESRGCTSRLGDITSSNELFDAIVRRSTADLDMLLTNTEYGLYPYAGIPWYSTIFGRDGIITAMQLVWNAPDIARGVLHALALTQATEIDETADAQPGKILHEMRGGEMARVGEVPFRRYYGTVDATPLFVMLAGDYFRRTGDVETIRAIWPNILAALEWIDIYGDADGDGFVEYCRMTERGLANQGWKDSHDSIFHADGRLAEGPIALCEVQGYVYAARRAAGELAGALGDSDRSERLHAQAEALRRLFEEKFWVEELGSYALALDGAKQPCSVLASNAGHALLTGIAAPDRAASIARLLTSPKFFNGWGVRTIASGEARYNPMSYHNGSIWPHDNALIAMGLARYGHKAEVARIFEGLFAAASYDELGRLPELFCGFPRRPRRGPTAYPVACSPQAWAAAAPFALLAASIGLEVDHKSERVLLNDPALPAFLNELWLPNVALAGSRLGLRLQRSDSDITVAVTRREGPARVVIFK